MVATRGLIKMGRALALCLLLVVWVPIGASGAEIAVVMRPPDTVSAGNFSAFAYDPATDAFRTGGYIAGHDFRWSEIIDDSVLPWDIDGGQLLSNWQLEIFARDGFAGNRASYNMWGMNHCALDGSFFLTAIASLKGQSGSARLDEEHDLVKHHPGFPDSPQVMPTNCWVSDAGGIYRLVDDNLTASDGFLAVGVQPGHRLTLFPIDWTAQVYAETYTITQVISDNEVRLDHDPSYSTTSPVTGVGYLLSVQPHVTLATFRQNLPYFADNLTKGPKAHHKGGMSLDGTTLYLAEIITDNLIAVDTQIPEQFSIFVSNTELQSYVQAQIDAGRHKAIVNSHRLYTDGLNGNWNDVSLDTTVDWVSVEEFVIGEESAKVTFDLAGAELAFESDDTKALDPIGYEAINFWIHGGATGGQQMDLWLVNSNGVGDSVTLTPPQAGIWTNVVIPVSTFNVADDVFWVVFRNTAGQSQPPFYLDQVVFDWTDPLPTWAGAFDAELAGMGTGQVDVDSQGRIWFSESETDDMLWTTDGVSLNTFLPSSTTSAVYSAEGAIDPDYYSASNAVQVMGLIVDPMGTVYWADNQTKSIWKAPAGNPASIVQLATKEEIKTALGLGTRSPRGLNCFSIRGMELLTFNFIDCNCMFAIDLETYDFGDFDADFDVDEGDYALFADCMSGPGVTEWPLDCTSSGFQMADLDGDGDVDLADSQRFQWFFTGSLP